jgi:hypothetical protein
VHSGERLLDLARSDAAPVEDLGCERLAVAHDCEQHVLGSSRKRVRRTPSVVECLLRAARDARAAGAGPLERAGSEPILDRPPYFVEVDPDRRQRRRIDARAVCRSEADDLDDFRAHVGRRDAELAKRARRLGTDVGEARQQDVLGADEAVAEGTRLLRPEDEQVVHLRRDLEAPLAQHPASSPAPEEPSPAVLLVHGLLANAEGAGDSLPGPALRPRGLDLELFERLQEDAKRRDRRQTDGGVFARRGACELGRLGHAVNVA